MEPASYWRREKWVRRALCAQPGVSADLFFSPDEGPDKEDDPYFDDALMFCYFCPVRMECREYADRMEEGQKYLFGVIGGEDPFERRERRKKANEAAALREEGAS